MVAAGSCVAAPLEGSLLCNAAAAAAGNFATLEGMKSQAYHQHLEASAPRRHGGNADFLRNQDHRNEEKSCFAASDAFSATAAATDNAPPCFAAVASRTSAGASAEAATLAVSASPAVIVAAAHVCSGRELSCGDPRAVDCSISDSAKNSSNAGHGVFKGQIPSPEKMQQQQQQATLTTTTEKWALTTSTSSEEDKSSQGSTPYFSHPSNTSTAFSLPCFGRLRRQNVCASDDRLCNVSSSSVTALCRRESSTCLDSKDIVNSAEEKTRDFLCEKEGSNVNFPHHTEIHKCSSSSSSSANSAASTGGDTGILCTTREDNANETKNCNQFPTDLSMPSCVADASKEEHESSTSTCLHSAYPCVVDGPLLFANKKSGRVSVGTNGSDASPVIPSSVAVGALDVKSVQLNAEVMQSWSILEEAKTFVEVADKSSAVAIAEGERASSKDTDAAMRGTDASSAGVSSLDIAWKDTEEERALTLPSDQVRHTEMQQGELQVSAVDDFFSLLASDVAIHGRGNARQQEQQQQQNDIVLSETQREQDTSMLPEKKEEECLLQCDPQLERLLQHREETPPIKQQQQQTERGEKYCNCGPSLHPRENVDVEEQAIATAGEIVSVQQQQQRHSAYSLDVRLEEVFDDDSCFHEMHAQKSSNNDEARSVEEPAFNSEGRHQGEGYHQEIEDVNNDNECSMIKRANQQQQEEHHSLLLPSSADINSMSTSSKTVSMTTTKQMEITPERRRDSRIEVPLLRAFPDGRKKDNSIVASSWHVPLWQKGVPLSEQQARGQQENQKQQQDETQDVEPEDVMMISLVSQNSVAQENYSCTVEGNATDVVETQQHKEAPTYSSDLWQTLGLALGRRQRKNSDISPCRSSRRNNSNSKTETSPTPSTMEAMQPLCLLPGSEDTTSSGREQGQQPSAGVAINTVPAGESSPNSSELTYLHEEGCDTKKEETIMEEDMFACHRSSNTEASGVVECEGTGASSVAETATISGAAEPRMCESSEDEDGDEEEHHNSILDTCLSTNVESITELSSSPPSTFTLWAKHQQRFVSTCAVNAPSAADIGDVNVHLLSSETNTAAATVASTDAEVVATRAVEKEDDVAESVISTNCSFLFSTLTETACEEKSTSGCCAVVAGTAGGSMGLCSSSDEDEDESGPEDESSTDLYESRCDGGDWSSRSVIEETTTSEEGCSAERKVVSGDSGFIPAYTHRFLKKKNVFRSSDPFQHEETVFIFDWDDTLLPSSWLSQKGLTLDSSNVEIDLWRKKLSAAAAHAEQTLYAARALGRVVIVTNAETGWIDLSCNKFMPDLAPLLGCFRIVSARSVYESSCCNTPFLWKVAAFTEELRRHFPVDTQRRWNVISVGDSTHEREALFSVCGRLGQFYNVTTKSLKLLEAPAVEDLHSQHELMLECLETVAKHKGNLDLCVASVLEAALEKGDYAGTPLPAGLERCTVGLHCLRYHPLAPEVVGRA